MNKKAFLACSILCMLWIVSALLVYINIKVFLVSNWYAAAFMAGFQIFTLIVLTVVTVHTYKVLTNKQNNNDY